jgi:hypothetical protein
MRPPPIIYERRGRRISVSLLARVLHNGSQQAVGAITDISFYGLRMTCRRVGFERGDFISVALPAIRDGASEGRVVQGRRLWCDVHAARRHPYISAGADGRIAPARSSSDNALVTTPLNGSHRSHQRPASISRQAGARSSGLPLFPHLRQAGHDGDRRSAGRQKAGSKRLR